MNDIVVELNNITKLFGDNKVLDCVNLKIQKGDFVTFLGPSGCGKTTLLRTIAGFYEPDFGYITINGKRIDKLPPYKRNTAMVFQEYALFPHMTVYENIAYGLKIKKENNEEIDKNVNKVLNLMQLQGMDKRYPNQLSGGQQQRVAIARALVMNPEVLLLDEPLSNLDAKLRENVRVELRVVQKKLGLTTIYVTHDQQEALSMSDKIVVIDKGIIHQYDTPMEIYFKPRTKFVADFIGTTNFIQGKVKRIDNGQIVVDYKDKEIYLLSEEKVSIDDKVVLSIRPESINLSYKEEKGSFFIEGNIIHSMFLGEKVRYIIIDKFSNQWIVDSFDSGRNILDGKVVLNMQKEKIHLIKDEKI